MARLPRYFLKDIPLHVILCGNNCEPIFANEEDSQFFMEALQDAGKHHGMLIHAYVLMATARPSSRRTACT